ncbi:anti-sigma factor family protein [Georgenia sp. AZ-5]|uniref:anti-sigma factor family protein n=1 Tax=Georgenia sp. AZ-5 TaxID=3367526 RepID=UPI003754F818
MSCAQAVARLWEYLDGTLDVEQRAGVDEHLAHCLMCCGELEFAKELRRLLARSAVEDLPDGVMERLRRTIEELGA